MSIETERLLLRHFRADDASAAHALFSDREAMRMVGMYPPFAHMEETVARIDRWASSEGRLTIVLKGTDELIGYLAVNPDSEEGREDTRELGFALIAGHRGKGYMKEAVSAVLRELSKQGVAYVWACCFKENASSERLIRGMGFEFMQEGRYAAPNDREYESLEFRITL